MGSSLISKASTVELSERLDQYPRIELAHLPTPLEFMPRLTDYLDGPKIFVKRDDCTGLATGGNKTRKLEFVMAEAKEMGATSIITQGAMQSNHARQTVAAACKLGMKCELILEQRVEKPDYLHSGNLLLDRLMGAETRVVSKGSDINAAMERVADEHRQRGDSPYIIPGGASTPIGALGYVDCARELMVQADEANLPIDVVVHATGSAGTQAGLVAGFKACNSDISVLGIGVNASREVQEERVFKLACETAALIEAGVTIGRSDITVNCDYIGDGYGISTRGMVTAVRLLARLEGLLFDPVYTGKGLAGMIDLVQKGYFSKVRSIVFVHTGGSAGLFAYQRQLLSG